MHNREPWVHGYQWHLYSYHILWPRLWFGVPQSHTSPTFILRILGKSPIACGLRTTVSGIITCHLIMPQKAIMRIAFIPEDSYHQHCVSGMCTLGSVHPLWSHTAVLLGHSSLDCCHYWNFHSQNLVGVQWWYRLRDRKEEGRRRKVNLGISDHTKRGNSDSLQHSRIVHTAKEVEKLMIQVWVLHIVYITIM